MDLQPGQRRLHSTCETPLPGSGRPNRKQAVRLEALAPQAGDATWAQRGRDSGRAVQSSGHIPGHSAVSDDSPPGHAGRCCVPSRLSLGRDIYPHAASMEPRMAVRLIPSSYRCDCGHESHFCENTVDELRAKSRRKKQLLADSDREVEHTIEFSDGEAVAVLCPRLGRRRITGWE